MYPDPISSKDLDTAARTIWGEGRGEPESGRIAIAHVIINRAAKGGWWGDTISKVCRKKWQFSAWNLGDPNREKMLSLKKSSEGYQQGLDAIVRAVISDDDPTQSATHYHTKAVTPHWVEGAKKVLTVGNHHFFSNVP